MAKTRPVHFGPAECARRTELAIPALKVYERLGLIVPTRDARRWGRYGPKELVRLNTIRTLKSLGLSLRQVRDVLTRQGPPLRQVFRLQLQTWRARKAAAVQAIRAVQGVFDKVERTQQLGVAVFGMKWQKGELTEFAPPIRKARQFLHDASVARARRERLHGPTV